MFWGNIKGTPIKWEIYPQLIEWHPQYIVNEDDVFFLFLEYFYFLNNHKSNKTPTTEPANNQKLPNITRIWLAILN
jgi:hypothetical protein